MVKGRLKKIGILLTVGLLVFAGCGQTTAQKQNAVGEGSETQEDNTVQTADGEDIPGWQKYAEEPITLDWYVNYSWFTAGWGENEVSKKITEETGVSINFITPKGNEAEKLNALIASDSLPDLITLGWWEQQVGEMIEGDMVYALNELADQYDMYFCQVGKEDIINWYTNEDGNIYCYPCSSCSARDLEEHDNIASNQTFLVRKDIYEALGEPDMTTIEGFKSAVEEAARLYPEVDGEPLIPVGAHAFSGQGNVSFDSYLMNFLAVPFEENGEIYDRFTNPDYIEWLKMFRELGEEGLLADDIFIDQRTQMEEKVATGRYFCMLYQYTDMADQQKELYTNYPDRIYIAVDGPQNQTGDDYTLPVTGINGWTVTLISKNCTQPERAISFLDYMLSEQGQLRAYLGVEGITYDEIDGVPVMKEEVRELLNTNRSEYDRLYGADDTYWMLQDEVMQLQWKQKGAAALEQPEEWTYPYVVYNGQYDAFLLTDTSEVYADNKITELWSETLPKLLLADSEESFDRIFEEFLEQREACGFDSVMDAKTDLMQKAKEKLGIE